MVSKAIDSAFLCLKTDKAVYSDFYDPKSAMVICNGLKKMSDVKITQFGGCEGTERVMLSFYPKSYGAEISELSFPITPLFIDSSKFSASLTHRDFLGSLIGLGIQRTKIGDIFVESGNATVFVHNGIKDFIIYSLEKVGRVSVKVTEREGEINLFTGGGKIIKATVPSMRCDAIVGEAFSLSRSKAAELIKSEKLFVNWAIESSVSATLKEGDKISARGLGRAVIRNVGGKTKKDRIFIELEKF